ncbi:MAG: hypothetical protein JXB49_29410 [Bacteroidales bacterium]|nr:hypothetical protein [Bacteroidales bacterium]
MKQIGFLIIIIVLIFSSCNQNNKTATTTENKLENIETPNKSNDSEEIQTLIRKVLNWSDSKNHIELLPVLTDSNDSIYIGFDLDKHKYNLVKMKSTDFFATEFIENYNQIILTLDKGLRNGEYEQWLVGDLPTFIFANDYSPWWNGQESFSIEKGTVELIKLDNESGEFNFTCGDKGLGCEGMENYKMRFRVIKENNKWKISYMEGFDFKESTRKDGVL